MPNKKIRYSRWIYQLKIISNLYRRFQQSQRPTRLDIATFLRQLATLFSASIPITRCCDILEKCQQKTTMRLIVYSIHKYLLTGRTLSDSFRQHPHCFDRLTCQLIEIGEHTGKLDIMFQNIANHQEKNLAFRKKIQQALFYPCIISATAIIVTLTLLIFVIPRFAELFSDTQTQLPRLTAWIFYLSRLVRQSAWLLIIVTGFICLLLFQNRYLARLKLYMIDITTKIPVIHHCLLKFALARFARNLALTFASGLSITDALTLIAGACGHADLAATTIMLRNRISAGLQLHHAMEESSLFPAMMVQMIKIGEESGQLDSMLDKTADFFEADMDALITRISQMAEPLIMILLGVLIGGLVIGMYLPIFNLGKTI